MQVTVPADLITWMDEQVRSRKFHHRSHLVEVALLELRKAAKASWPGKMDQR